MNNYTSPGPETGAGVAVEKCGAAVIGKYDSKALAVGQAVLRDTDAEDVILIGSRARGDYHEHSDVDFIFIHPRWREDEEIRDRARHAARATAEALYGEFIPVDFVWFTPEEFDHLRRSINSIAAIATEEGITMDGQSAGDVYPNDGGDYSGGDYSNEWTNTDQRCYHTRSHLHALRAIIDSGGAVIMVGQQAHQTLEHALKALISASGRRYAHHHNLVSLEGDARRFDRGFTHSLESPLEALNDYSGRIKYDGPYAPLGDREELYRKVLSDTRQIFQRVAELTGRDPWQEQPREDD